MSDTDDTIYCQFYDEAGNGPVALEVKVDNFADLGLRNPIFGFGFELAAAEFNMNGAPVGGGITFYRDSAVRLHAALSEWLRNNPDATKETTHG